MSQDLSLSPVDIAYTVYYPLGWTLTQCEDYRLLPGCFTLYRGWNGLRFAFSLVKEVPVVKAHENGSPHMTWESWSHIIFTMRKPREHMPARVMRIYYNQGHSPASAWAQQRR